MRRVLTWRAARSSPHARAAQSLQKGLFDPKHGDYEWVRPPPGDAAGASRRRFAL